MVESKTITATILKYSRTDTKLHKLFEHVQEYAQVYNLAKQRQKGCDGMGEVATLKDEFNSILEEITKYCKDKGYISEDIHISLDEIADEILIDKSD